MTFAVLFAVCVLGMRDDLNMRVHLTVDPDGSVSDLVKTFSVVEKRHSVVKKRSSVDAALESLILEANARLDDVAASPRLGQDKQHIESHHKGGIQDLVGSAAHLAAANAKNQVGMAHEDIKKLNLKAPKHPVQTHVMLERDAVAMNMSHLGPIRYHPFEMAQEHHTASGKVRSRSDSGDCDCMSSWTINGFHCPESKHGCCKYPGISAPICQHKDHGNSKCRKTPAHGLIDYCTEPLVGHVSKCPCLNEWSTMDGVGCDLDKNGCCNPNNNAGGDWCFPVPNYEGGSCNMDALGGKNWDTCGASTTADGPRETNNGCRCRQDQWKYKGAYSGATDQNEGCYNPDSDSGGSWCYIDKEISSASCTRSKWDYCDVPTGMGGEIKGCIDNIIDMDKLCWSDTEFLVLNGADIIGDAVWVHSGVFAPTPLGRYATCDSSKYVCPPERAETAMDRYNLHAVVQAEKQANKVHCDVRGSRGLTDCQGATRRRVTPPTSEPTPPPAAPRHVCPHGTTSMCIDVCSGQFTPPAGCAVPECACPDVAECPDLSNYCDSVCDPNVEVPHNPGHCPQISITCPPCEPTPPPQPISCERTPCQLTPLCKHYPPMQRPTRGPIGNNCCACPEDEPTTRTTAPTTPPTAPPPVVATPAPTPVPSPAPTPVPSPVPSPSAQAIELSLKAGSSDLHHTSRIYERSAGLRDGSESVAWGTSDNGYKFRGEFIRRGAVVEFLMTGGSDVKTLAYKQVKVQLHGTANKMNYVFTPDWGGACSSDSSCELTAALDCTTPIGKYNLVVCIGDGVGEEKKCDDMEVVVLFNAWAPECQEYVKTSTPELFEEYIQYVTDETTVQWRGSYDAFSGQYWSLDQNYQPIIFAAIELLDELPAEARGNPLRVARELTYRIGKSVCYGRWDGSYDTHGMSVSGGYQCDQQGGSGYKCHKPTDHKDAKTMFDQWWSMYEFNDRPLKLQFCQCWVYAGVTNAVSRALGLASRSVTNFKSAHDTNKDQVISKVYEKSATGGFKSVQGNKWCPAWCRQERSFDGCDYASCHHEILSGRGFDARPQCKPCRVCTGCLGLGDSVWNFHVWNELYANGGSTQDWWAYDSTPQEYSGGRYQCGPNSLSHLFGDKITCEDALFIQSEVNAIERVVAYSETPFSSTNGALGNHEFQYNGKTWYMATSNGNPYYTERETSPWSGGEDIGAKTMTTSPGPVDEKCKTQSPYFCWSRLQEVTYVYKPEEPSGPANTDAELLADPDGPSSLCTEVYENPKTNPNAPTSSIAIDTNCHGSGQCVDGGSLLETETNTSSKWHGLPGSLAQRFRKNAETCATRPSAIQNLAGSCSTNEEVVFHADNLLGDCQDEGQTTTDDSLSVNWSLGGALHASFDVHNPLTIPVVVTAGIEAKVIGGNIGTPKKCIESTFNSNLGGGSASEWKSYHFTFGAQCAKQDNPTLRQLAHLQSRDECAFHEQNVTIAPGATVAIQFTSEIEQLKHLCQFQSCIDQNDLIHVDVYATAYGANGCEQTIQRKVQRVINDFTTADPQQICGSNGFDADPFLAGNQYVDGDQYTFS